MVECFVFLRPLGLRLVMIKRDSRGHSYFIVRGEILGFMKDELLRKHLPRMFSLIKNESWGQDRRGCKGSLFARDGSDVIGLNI